MFLGAGFSHDFPAVDGFRLAVGNRGITVGMQFRRGERLTAIQVSVEHGDESWPFLDDANPGVAVAVDVSLVAFGQTEEAFQIEIVVGQVRLLAADKQAGEKAGHHLTHMLSDRIVAGLELVPQGFETRLALGGSALERVESRVDLGHVRYLLANELLGFLDGGQAAVDAVGQPLELVVSRDPFFSSKLIWRESRISWRAPAMRKPGGCKGPP